MRFHIITIFPELIKTISEVGILFKAQKKEILHIEAHNLRDYTKDEHHSVDDEPYGGGPGMIFKIEPMYDAIMSICKNRSRPKTILMGPGGGVFDHKKAKSLAKEKELIFICARYEGIDQRIREHLVDEEISIGDYVLMGGELPTMVVIEAICRFVPGVPGKSSSLDDESFSKGLLEYPQYTRPSVFKGWDVPEILLSGHHANIEKWRHRQSLLRTAKCRSDLLSNLQLSQEDIDWLEQSTQ